ncbi:DUF4393 domain-containing protein (plasmid) [Microbulbifer sp. CnH-101-E]|uniref:DUF4393 domain-containing protein n=1 Tax=unclassified Microbulbifer TaxID=2619833 RepID=UPI0040393F06
MSDNESNVEGTINAVTGLVEKVPVYQDLVQPLAQQTGKALGTVGETVNAALIPIRGLIWGVEQIEDFVKTKLSKKLASTPPENIQTPDPSVAGPAIESLRFVEGKPDLAELYANLIASSMDKNTSQAAHPGFVEIIRNLSGDEARILSFLEPGELQPIIDIRRENKENSVGNIKSGYVTTIGRDADCKHPKLVATYLRNLERLGLVDIPRGSTIAEAGAYDRITNDPSVVALTEKLNKLPNSKASIVKYYFGLSALGEQFKEACVNNRESSTVKG